MVRAYRFSCFTVVAELCNSFVSSTVMIYDLACECVVCDEDGVVDLLLLLYGERSS